LSNIFDIDDAVGGEMFNLLDISLIVNPGVGCLKINAKNF
jgi:hypothetical protein